ncbi:hypothetical protein [Leptospira mayottensis]|uniref:hypothetical protein n=1 Tax=Leptospira mayottensis TaxID=1137606 RepID=UPI001AF01FFD|nr:hypothetical protein [Leptospira mayottensis]
MNVAEIKIKLYLFDKSLLSFFVRVPAKKYRNPEVPDRKRSLFRLGFSENLANRDKRQVLRNLGEQELSSTNSIGVRKGDSKLFPFSLMRNAKS